MRSPVCKLLVSLLILTALAAVSSSPAAASPPKFGLATLSLYGGEPSIWASDQGVLYDTTPSGGTILFRSTNGGKSWVQTKTADPSSGDTCVATDQSGAVYECNLAGSQSVHPLEADVWKSLDEGNSWKYGNNPINTGGANVCGTSCNPFGVDRQWVDAYIPKGKTTTNAIVLLAYHDFYGPSHIWFNLSTDGGRSYGPSENIFQHGKHNENTLWALANSDCNTVPTGARIVKSGPHAGRMYVSWISSDPESPATGCNVSMAQSFHNVWVAWSDDKGKTWDIRLAYDAGPFHDASTPFAAFTLDKSGNPYVAFDSPAPGENAQKCAAESTAGTVQSDSSCAYHLWVVWSKDGGKTWDGGGGMFAGTAAKAYEVDPSKKPQTDLFPTIAAGKPGHVAVGWLRTNEIVPTDPLGKFDPGGCAGPGTAGVPTYPPTCKWNLYAGQTANLTQKPSKQTWTMSQLTPTPMHVGDICNLGIACIPYVSDRNLLDFNSEALDTTTGCVHIAYADDHNLYGTGKDRGNRLRVANQISGPSIQGGTCKLRRKPVPPPPKKHPGGSGGKHHQGSGGKHHQGSGGKHHQGSGQHKPSHKPKHHHRRGFTG
jgi:hypothetical protein